MDEMQYRGAPNVPLIKREVASPEDQANYSTLKNIHTAFADKLEELHKNFNAFIILEGGSTLDKVEDLLLQVKGNQTAYDILIPLFQELDQSLAKIDADYRAAQERSQREKQF